MAYDMVFSGAPDQEGEVETFFLCSTGAWEKVRAWAASVDGAPALKELAEQGDFTGTDELAREIAGLNPPEGVKATLAALAEKMGVGDPEETITVTDEADDGEEPESTEGEPVVESLANDRLTRAAKILFEEYP